MSAFDPFASGLATEGEFDPFTSGAATATDTKPAPEMAERLFGGVDQLQKVLPAEAYSALSQASKGSGDEPLTQMRAISTAYLATRYGKTAEEIAPVYEQYRDDFAKTVLHHTGQIDDAGFYQKVGAHLQQKKAERGMLNAMTISLFDGLRKGQDFATSFESERKMRGAQPGWDAFNQDLYRQFAQEQWDRFQSKRSALEGAIAPVAQYLTLAKTPPPAGSETYWDELQAAKATALSSLAGLSQDDAEIAMDFAAGQASETPEADRSFMDKVAGRVTRGADSFIRGVIGAGQESIRQRKRLYGAIAPSIYGDAAAGVDQERRSAQLERKLDQRLTGEVDPMKGSGWVTTGLLDAAESTPRMLASFTVPGIAVNVLATKEDLRGEFEDKGVPAGSANVLSSIAAVPYAALDFLQAKMAFGGEVPGLSKILAAPARTGVQTARKVAVTAGLEFVEQLGQEVSQDLVAPTAQSLASVLSSEIPQVKWEDELRRIKDATPETAASLLPFVLIGTGTATFKDRAYAREYLRQEAHLRALGFSDEAIGKVMDSATPEQASAIIQTEWDKRGAVNGDALADLNDESIQARVDAGDVISQAARDLFEKYPGHFDNIPPNHIPVEVQREDGTIVPGVMNGYYENPMGGAPFPSVGYKSDMGWSHGIVGFGSDKSRVITEVPSPEEWSPGTFGVRKTEDGQLAVTDKAGTHMGMATTPEGAAQIIRGPKREVNVDTSTTGAALDARAMATQGLALGDPDGELGSVFQAGRPNRATIYTKPAPGVKGGVNAPSVIEAMAAVLEAGGQNPGIIRFGRMGRQGKRASGFYRPKDRIIRIKTANNIETAAHEVAHGIEDLLWGIGHVWQEAGNVTQKAHGEMLQLGHDLYGERVPNGGYASEGFAEFFRLYVTDPEQAKAKAPAFFGEWEKTILSSVDGLETAVRKVQRMGTTFYRQGSMERAKQGIAPQPGRIEAVKEATETQLEAFRRKWSDMAAPIADFVQAAKEQGATVPEADDPYFTLTARRMTADAVAGYMATKGMLDLSGNVVGKPLQDAFALVGKENASDFTVYLWAKRALALWTDPNGARNPGLAKIDAEELVNELETPAFQQAAQIVYDWNNGVLEYAAQASPDFARAVQKIRQNDPGFYIPLFREFKSLDERYGGRAGARGKNLVQHLKGSGRRIKDPIESMLTQAKAIVLKAHQKIVLDQMIKLADKVPGLGAYVTEVPVDQVAQVVPQWQVIKGLVDAIEAKAGSQQAKLVGDTLETVLDGDVFTFFAPATSPKQNEAPVLPIYKDGKVHWYEMDPELYKALSGMDLVRLPKALDLFLGMPARVSRIGTTGLRASFSLVTNPLRDFRTLMVNSQASANSGELFILWMDSLKDLFVHAATFGKVGDEWSDIATRLGVEMAQPLTQDSRPLEAAARKMKRAGAWSAVDMKDTTDLIRTFLQFPETASRLAEMRAVAKDLGWDPSMPLTPAIAAKLATVGKQVTTDFTQAGEYARVINQAVPFFNAQIQGPVAHIRALKADPTKFVLRGLMGTAMALALWYRNKDREWWKDMAAKERYMYSYFEIGDQLVRIPRSYEVDGIFMAMSEAMMDAWYQSDPAKAGQWAKTFIEMMTPFDNYKGIPTPPLPVLPKLAAQQLANRDFFFDSPIVPRGELDTVRPAEQYNEFTSTVAIRIGEMFNVSPRRIDFTIRNLFGPVGNDLVTLFGRGSGSQKPVEREREMADIPVFGVLFQRGGPVARNPESVQKLYDAYEEALNIQHSKREKETKEQRSKRLMLQDAVRAQAALSIIARHTPETEKRSEIYALRLQVAKSAVTMAESGKIDRASVRKILSEASRTAKVMQPDEP